MRANKLGLSLLVALALAGVGGRATAGQLGLCNGKGECPPASYSPLNYWAPELYRCHVQRYCRVHEDCIGQPCQGFSFSGKIASWRGPAVAPYDTYAGTGQSYDPYFRVNPAVKGTPAKTPPTKGGN